MAGSTRFAWGPSGWGLPLSPSSIPSCPRVVDPCAAGSIVQPAHPFLCCNSPFRVMTCSDAQGENGVHSQRCSRETPGRPGASPGAHSWEYLPFWKSEWLKLQAVSLLQATSSCFPSSLKQHVGELRPGHWPKQMSWDFYILWEREGEIPYVGQTSPLNYIAKLVEIKWIHPSTLHR